MAVTYLRLFPAVNQFEVRNGQLNVAGQLKVYFEGTDDLADLYDENGTQLAQPVVLDDNGRARGLLVDSSKVYRLEVYDCYGELLYTVRKMVPSGGGAGSSLGNRYDVISTDGSITVDRYDDGGVTKFDLGIGPSDSDEFLEWIKCSEEDCGSTWIPVYQEGTMETTAQGIGVHRGQLYHFTSTFYVDPDGTGTTYGTFTVNMYCDGEIVDSRNFDIDTSVNDAVQCEFSTDVIPEADGHVYFKLTIPSTCEVTGKVQAHRIYSGINAVPGTCATKQWVQETFDYGMSGKIGYSALGYNGDGDITGISGSSIAGGLDSAAVSSIASSYAESAASSKQDISGMSAWIPWSGSSVFQPSGDYAFNSSLSSLVHNSSYSSFSAQVTGDISGLSSTVSGISGELSSKADGSALGEKFDKSASGMLQPSGDYAFNSAVSSKVDQSAFDDCCSSVRSALGDKLDKSASGQFAPSADYAYNSSLSAYYPASASGAFQPSGNYQTAGDYAFNSSVSSKLDASASGDFVLNSAFSSWSADVDSSITNIESSIASMSSDMSAYVPFSGLEGDGMKITGISGSAIKGHEYMGISPVNVDNVNGTISVDHRTLCVDSTLTAYNSGSSAVLGVNVSALDISSKLDASASSMFQLSGDYAYNSSLDDKLDTTAFSTVSGDFLTSHQSLAGYATESYVDSAVSGKLDVTASSQFLTSLPEDLAYTSDVASAVSGKLDNSASSLWYPMSGNPSGFLTAHQSLAGYATEQYVDSAVSSKLDTSAYDSAQFQLTADMSGYQPSGDYIYESALGWAEV